MVLPISLAFERHAIFCCVIVGVILRTMKTSGLAFTCLKSFVNCRFILLCSQQKLLEFFPLSSDCVFWFESDGTLEAPVLSSDLSLSCYMLVFFTFYDDADLYRFLAFIKKLFSSLEYVDLLILPLILFHSSVFCAICRRIWALGW